MSLTKQTLEVNDKTGEIVLANTVETDDVERENYLQRMENPKGMSEKRTFRTLGRIPEFEFYADPMLRCYLEQLQTGDQLGARKTISVYLQLHPEYRTSEGST